MLFFILIYMELGNSVSNSTKYSIMSVLSNGKWFCLGSSGVSNNVYYWRSQTDSSDISSFPARWGESPIGCYYNP